MKFYKVLKNGKSCNGGEMTWSLPVDNNDGTQTPGEWMPEISGKLVPCENGYHLCKRETLVEWLNEEIYEAESSGEIVEYDNKVVVRRVRLTKRFNNWNDRTARLFAADCASHVLHILENKYPYDKRPRNAIQAARKFARGEIDGTILIAARDAALDAANDIAKDAVNDIAKDAVMFVAASTTYSIDVVYDTPIYAAGAATWNITADTAMCITTDTETRVSNNSVLMDMADELFDTEHNWQTSLLFEYLEND